MAQITIEQALDDLRRGVVRAVFTKKDGSTRVMYATRNAKLIELYDKPFRQTGMKNWYDIQTQLEKQKESGMLNVIDLEKQEWRKLTIPKLIPEHDGLPGWIAFDEDDPVWFEIAVKGKDENDFRTTQGTIEIPAEVKDDIATTRNELETEYYTEGQQSGAYKTPEQLEKEALNYEDYLIGESAYTKALNNAYIPEEVGEVDNLIQEFIRGIHAVTDGKRTLPNGHQMYISKGQAKKRYTEEGEQRGYELNIGGTKIIMAPYYIVNMTTGRVYLDRLNKFSFSNPIRPTMDTKTPDSIIEPYINFFINKYKLDNLELPSKQGGRTITVRDIRRLERLNYWEQNRTNPAIKEILDKYKVRIKQEKGTNMYSLTITGNNTQFLFNTRAVYYRATNAEGAEPILIVNAKTDTAALKEMREGIHATARMAQGYPELVKGLKIFEELVIDTIFNMRKHVPKLA